MFLWPDGKKYIGSFKNDKKEGYGELEYSDGRKFRGNWLKNKENGIGEFLENGESNWKKGEWQRGSLVAWLDEENPQL